MTLLSALQDAAVLCSLARPTQIVGVSQETEMMLLALAKREAAEALRRHDWPKLTRTHTWTMSLASLQASGLPSDFERMIDDTAWNRTKDEPIGGPLTHQEYARAYGEPIVTTITQWLMRRYDGLHIYPVPTAADAGAFEYIINTPVLAQDGSTYKTTFSADTDAYVIGGDELLTLGVTWRFLKQKGLDYAEALRDYELRVSSEINSMRGAKAVSIASPDMDPLLDPNIPESGFAGA